MFEFFDKRPETINKQIIDSWEESKLHLNAFSTDEINQLIKIFKTAPKTNNMTKQNKMFDDFLNSESVDKTITPSQRFGQGSGAFSAPVCWDEGSKEILDPVLKKCIGDYKIVGGTFNMTMNPYRLHTDSGRLKETKIHKQIIIPLHWDRTLDVYSILYDQRWTGCQARFQRGLSQTSEEKFTTTTHMTITDYENSQIHNLTNEPFDNHLYESLASHINYESLWGFSIELAAKWTPQSLIAYDRSVIHSSCHFASSKLKTKLFITLVTEQPDD